MSELAQMLSDAFVPRPVAPDIRSRRQRLCEYIRRHEARVFDVTHPRADTVRTLLGWDDETMAAFVDSPLLCHSSPHAGMNSFPPMLAFPWILGSAIRLAQKRHGEPAVHLRTQCTHHDFNDTFAKPHAWWRRTPEGEVVKTHLFKRLPIKYHPMFAKPAPQVPHDSLHPVDRQAVELAELGTGYGSYCVIYRMYLERLAGFHEPYRVIEVPIDLLNRHTVMDVGMTTWYQAVSEARMNLRLEVPDAPMAAMSAEDAAAVADAAEPWPSRAVIAPNTVNFAQFYRLGLSLMLGGRRMASYVPGMNDEIAQFVHGLAGWQCEPPAFFPFTTVPFVELLGMQQEAERCQREWGIATSLALVSSALAGEAAQRLEPMLALDYDTLFDRSLV